MRYFIHDELDEVWAIREDGYHKCLTPERDEFELDSEYRDTTYDDWADPAEHGSLYDHINEHQESYKELTEEEAFLELV